MVIRLIFWCLPALILLGGCAGLPAAPSAPTASPTPTITPYPTRDPTYDEGGQFCPPPRAWYEYIVRPGDTIRSLAEKTNSTVTQLAAANCLQNPRLIYVGQLFYVPRRIRD